MTDLTPRQLVDAVTRSLNETWQRMAAKYKNADQPVTNAQERKRLGTEAGRRKRSASRVRKES
jgi:hypothetical protein